MTAPSKRGEYSHGAPVPPPAFGPPGQGGSWGRKHPADHLPEVPPAPGEVVEIGANTTISSGIDLQGDGSK
jgi:hypothetical protein